MIRIAELNCPEGHPRASSVYDDSRTPADVAERSTRSSYASTCRHPCALCGKAEVNFVDRDTGYPDMVTAVFEEERRLAAHIRKLMELVAVKRARHERN